MKNKYSIFNYLTQELLQQSNLMDYNGNVFIELYCNQVFGNDFFLQLVCNGARLEWYRSTWLKDKDSLSMNKWFDDFEDEEAYNLNLTITKESGVAERNLMNEILKKINKLTIKPVLFNDAQGRDGLGVLLTIGSSTERTTIGWETRCTPEEWSNLDVLLELFLELNKNLVATKKQDFSIGYQYEENEGNFTKMLVLDKLIVK